MNPLAIIKLNAINLLLEAEVFLRAVKKSALCLAAAEDEQGESISKTDPRMVSEVRLLSYYLSSQHWTEWLWRLFKGDKHTHTKSVSK